MIFSTQLLLVQKIVHIFAEKRKTMITTTISDFRKSIKGYIDRVIATNEPVVINRGVQGAVLVSLDEYNALARTASVLNSQVGADTLKAAQEQNFIEVDIDAL
ncbi:MAG: type II toxin-antitoxin system Phd/YefM family antitoxin [Bacteroidaceae bacterium]|nr:type II toxin-antitoxin system Phd/YefM family antitoxin [Bacteroidaceae bacterium]